MSYTVFISRDPASENDARQITHEEWVRLAKLDPEFEESSDFDGEGELVYCWIPHPDHPSFHFYEGLGIGVRLRDLAIFQKLFEIAEKLSAVVVGENLELYRMTDRGVEQYWENSANGLPTIVYPIDS